MSKRATDTPKRIFFIGMMGTPGSYDTSVYDHFEDKDNEGIWFTKRFSHVAGISLHTCNVCTDAPLPLPNDVDGLVLAGSYNSVHDHTAWQQVVREWLPVMRAHKIPILAICGSHQLISHMHGAEVAYVDPVKHAPYAGTFSVQLTEAGKSCPVMKSLGDSGDFQYANSEHVVLMPDGSTLLASSAEIPVAALDWGNHCYSTQFHPEGTHETLGTVWRFKSPELMGNYRESQDGAELVENFLRLVAGLVSPPTDMNLEQET